jgi:guanylate kinase
VSCTTRQRRVSEIDGVDYRFITRDRFDELVANGEFLERTECYGNRYGTLKSAVYDVFTNNNLCIIDLDFRGAYKALSMDIIPEYECIGILVLPPSLRALENRLALRNSETAESIKRRLEESFSVREVADYKHVIINDNVDVASARIKTIISALI